MSVVFAHAKGETFSDLLPAFGSTFEAEVSSQKGPGKFVYIHKALVVV